MNSWEAIAYTSKPSRKASSAGNARQTVDAVGGTSVQAHRAGLERIMQARAHPVSWVQLICEMQRDWSRKQTSEMFAEILFSKPPRASEG
jgi:hypothetical protein